MQDCVCFLHHCVPITQSLGHATLNRCSLNIANDLFRLKNIVLGNTRDELSMYFWQSVFKIEIRTIDERKCNLEHKTKPLSKDCF